MRLSRIAAVLPFVAVALSGCFQMASLLTVHGDGRATLVETMTLSEQALSFARADSTRGGLADRAMLDARAASLGPGVALVSVDETDTGYTATYGVADVNRLSFTLPRPPTGDDALPDSADTDAPFTFALARSGRSRTLVVTVPDNAADAPPDTSAADPAQQQQALAMARLLLGDARVTFRVAVHGQITGTTGSFFDDDAATLVDLQMGALFDLLAEHPELMGSASPPLTELSRLADGRDGLKIQLPGTVIVRFE